MFTGPCTKFTLQHFAFLTVATQIIKCYCSWYYISSWSDNITIKYILTYICGFRAMIHSRPTEVKANMTHKQPPTRTQTQASSGANICGEVSLGGITSFNIQTSQYSETLGQILRVEEAACNLSEPIQFSSYKQRNTARCRCAWLPGSSLLCTDDSCTSHIFHHLPLFQYWCCYDSCFMLQVRLNEVFIGRILQCASFISLPPLHRDRVLTIIWTSEVWLPELWSCFVLDYLEWD